MQMNFSERYGPYLQLAFNILLPTIGILFFHWSIGDLFCLFFVELLLMGSVTCLKILGAVNDGGIFGRIGSMFLFILIFCMFFIFIAVLTGNFFNGGDERMNITLTRTTFNILAGSYILNLGAYFASGKFKRTKTNAIRKETLLYLASLFAVLMLVLIPFGTMVRSGAINIALGISIVIARNLVDFLIIRNANTSLQKNR